MGDLPILPEARDAFLAAVEYYNSASAGLGEEFIGDVEMAVSRIRSFPGHGSPWLGGTRRVVLGRFPFDVVYLEDAEGLVGHCGRTPEAIALLLAGSAVVPPTAGGGASA